MLLDVHGEEDLPYCFIAGAEGILGWNDQLKHVQDAFVMALLRASPDFQSKMGYGADPPGQADLSIGSNQVYVRMRTAWQHFSTVFTWSVCCLLLLVELITYLVLVPPECSRRMMWFILLNLWAWLGAR